VQMICILSTTDAYHLLSKTLLVPVHPGSHGKEAVQQVSSSSSTSSTNCSERKMNFRIVQMINFGLNVIKKSIRNQPDKQFVF